MDFYRIKERITKKDSIEIYPDFKTVKSKDLMVRGGKFYAIWNEELGLWSTDEYDVPILVDKTLNEYKDKIKDRVDGNVAIRYMEDFSSKSWIEYKKYINSVSDNSRQLDEKLTFANSKVKRKDYVSKRLPYDLKKGQIDGWDELIGTLYETDERAKLEWAVGSVIAGDARFIQKFIVLYGDPGSGKGTFIDILQRIFKGYYKAFNAKALGSSGNDFATEVFKTNPLVAIQHDGDLSKIEDNARLNSIISHEEMSLNEKYKSSYTSSINAFLFMGTNKPVKITDAKSGIIRRLIDVSPSGKRIPPKHYEILKEKIGFELGAIAWHCQDVYHRMGKNYYNGYKPINMMMQTDIFFNFIESNYFVFKEQNGVSLKQAYEMYKIYCDDALIQYKLSRHKFREELKNYFEKFYEVTRVDGKQVRSYYEVFLSNKLSSVKTLEEVEEHPYPLVLDKTESLLDELCSDMPAQYATRAQTPRDEWNDVKTTLKDINTKEMHYLRLPINHIVIDFDIKDGKGNKSLELNIEAASKWPPTYSEVSKGGNGIHLHYFYDGDTEMLSRLYSVDIEIKVFKGKSSLRRKMSKCNNVDIATINSGLPLKEKKMINFEGVKNEKALRTLIVKCLKKEIHPGTKSNVDFIFKLLDDAYKGGLHYDVSDMAKDILVFGSSSTNQSDHCIKIISDMKFKSEEANAPDRDYDHEEIVFFDIEVLKNLFLVCWKYKGKDEMVVMVNPTSAEVEPLLKMMIVGYNCRRYDNHVMYARFIGYTLEQVYKVSQRIISNEKNATFSEAYSLSYTDVYEYLLKKQSLKKWEVELGIQHTEMEIDWNEPLPDERLQEIIDYCCDDVRALEEVFNENPSDWAARLMLSKMSKLTPNDSTARHAERIMFGFDREPQKHFIQPDLSLEFPGYTFIRGKSRYRDMDVSEGGQIYAEPGMYGNVALLDIEAMHPTTAEITNHFGKYTEKYTGIVNARKDIKHGNWDSARTRLNGMLAEFLTDELIKDKVYIKGVSDALKRAANIVYGNSCAKYKNKFRGPDNKDNVLAKRGALFMIDLLYAVREQGFSVIHIKTDSVKIPDATPEIIKFVQDFGAKYGYNFEHEASYDKLCLINETEYIGKDMETGEWSATGVQFSHPYVFKKLFSHEEVEFKDMCEIRNTSTKLFLDFNEKLQEDQHEYIFVGGVGSFCPIKPGKGGGLLMRKDKELDKYHAATRTKGWRWMESNSLKSMIGMTGDIIDYSYADHLVDNIIENMEKYGDVEWFTSEDKYVMGENGIIPF